MHCPGCGHDFNGAKGVLIHLKRTTNNNCQEAYKEMFGLDSESDVESSSKSSDDIDADTEDMLARAANDPEMLSDIVFPPDPELAGAEANSDFFGSFHEEENADNDGEIQFDIQMDDISLGLDDNVPELDEDSDDDEENEYIW